MKTPLQQIKDNYYKMSESQFHYWMSQNIDKLVQEEKVTVVEKDKVIKVAPRLGEYGCQVDRVRVSSKVKLKFRVGRLGRGNKPMCDKQK